MDSNTYIVKINSALSNKPFFIKIDDPSLSVDTIFNEAIIQLKNAGKPLESQQLAQLYERHQIFNSGNIVQKGDLFSDLIKKKQVVGDQEVKIAELDLVTSHSGG
ncbi:MAG: hypothetical protein K9W44_03790 [Candidatus Lokiarchaeota archaeon]|nr:hypothetical protein [Candidatus Harpocratesius repetitus]